MGPSRPFPELSRAALSVRRSPRRTEGRRRSHDDALSVTSDASPTTDPVVIGAAIVDRLQSIVAREITPRETAVVTVGRFHAGSANNIIPATAELGLTMRSTSHGRQTQILAVVQRIVRAECEAAGVTTGPDHTSPCDLQIPGWRILNVVAIRAGRRAVTAALQQVAGFDARSCLQTKSGGDRRSNVQVVILVAHRPTPSAARCPGAVGLHQNLTQPHRRVPWHMTGTVLNQRS